MGKFCKKCGAELKENEMFCGKCGTRTEVSEYTYQRPVPPANTGNQLPTKMQWLLCLGLQLACMALYFLPTLQVELASFFGESTIETTSMLKQLSTDGSPILYLLLLIVYLVATLIMLLPVLQNKRKSEKNLNFLQIMSAAFFAVNAIVFIFMKNEVKEQGFGLAQLVPSVWGWLYIIASAAAIVYLAVLSKKEKENR